MKIELSFVSKTHFVFIQMFSMGMSIDRHSQVVTNLMKDSSIIFRIKSKKKSFELF
jgi:hypothetical protein